MLVPNCHPRGGRALVSSAAAAVLLLLPAAHAQPVVQRLPDPAAAELSGALQRLSADPRSLAALLDAGHAALDLNDLDAAQGFLARAQAIAPEDGRVLAGLARLAVARRDGVSALRLFDEAATRGFRLEEYAAEQGLAYDLVGLNSRAQVLYGQALSRTKDDAVLRRLALSYAIAGEHEAAEATLLPLLQAQDLPAFRTRAFALAIGGKADEAVAIAEAMLPPRVAQGLAPYLRFMPRLTRAQQAAAANFGEFPATAQIGRDDPAVLAYASAEPSPVPVAVPRSDDARLIPGGEPLEPPAAVAAIAIELPPEPAPTPSAAIELPPTPEEPPRRVALADAFADFDLPPPPPPVPTTPDAVDITRIVPAREASPAADPPVRRLPVNPSRHWVQVATGQDVEKFRWDWRRIGGQAEGLLEGKSAYFAAWGANNRLVTGPFTTEKEAQAFVTSLAEKGVSSFVFTSTSGERVLALP